MILKGQIFLFPETTATIRNASHYGRGKEKKSDLDRVTFTSDPLRKYSPRSYIPAGMQETIIKFLERGILFYLPADIIPLAGEGAMKAISDTTNVLFFKGENRV